MKPIVAAFDFDGTLTRSDTLLPFLRHVLGPVRFTHYLTWLMPTLVGYKCGAIANDIAKRTVLKRCLGGRSRTSLDTLGEQFAKTYIPRTLRPAILAKLQDHQSQGHTCVLVSSSLDVYLKPWAQAQGFAACLCTELAYDSHDLATGDFAGENCFGSQKVARLSAWLESFGPVTLHAYGNSRGDKELLDLADVAFYRGQSGRCPIG